MHPSTVCMYHVLPIVNSARMKRASWERERKREKERGPISLVRSEHDDIRTRPEETSLSTWKPARTNERFGIRYYLWRGPRRANGGVKPGKRSPFSGPRAKIRISLAPPSRSPSRKKERERESRPSRKFSSKRSPAAPARTKSRVSRALNAV